MKEVRKIKEDIYYVGGSDTRIELFENVFPVPEGITYNSYLIKDEKNILMDTVDYAIGREFLENVEAVLQGEKLDYLVIQHMEPDHCALMKEILKKYPDITVVGNKLTKKLILNFFEDMVFNFLEVEENDSIHTGKHILRFIMAPMVHWPEVMMTYDETDKILFSADAFGSFKTMDGNLFDDEVDFKEQWLDEARRYYTNIVGKYGMQTLKALNKTATLDIQMIAPLHGPVHRSDISWFMKKYQTWASYEPEEQAVLIVYGSIYGNTEKAANLLADELSRQGVKKIKTYDVSKIHPSYLVSESFRASHIVFASVNYNGGIFVNMENLLRDLKAHNLQNRTVAYIENGSWVCTAAKIMDDVVSTMKNMNVLAEKVTIQSSLKKHQYEEIVKLASAIKASMNL